MVDKQNSTKEDATINNCLRRTQAVQLFLTHRNVLFNLKYINL